MPHPLAADFGEGDFHDALVSDDDLELPDQFFEFLLMRRGPWVGDDLAEADDGSVVTPLDRVGAARSHRSPVLARLRASSDTRIAILVPRPLGESRSATSAQLRTIANPPEGWSTLVRVRPPFP